MYKDMFSRGSVISKEGISREIELVTFIELLPNTRSWVRFFGILDLI